jgi:flavin-dependent dehydrogenase
VSARAQDFDVAIAGGGLAGNLLAHQLSRRLPQLRIGLFERETETSFKVGEATVEISANHLIRRHGLSTYLYERQLPKNGLRYFFDTERRDAELEAMSEIGTEGLPLHPAFQLDRARLEEDLFERNQRRGVSVRRGVRVHDIELGKDGAPHRFCVSDAAGTTDVSGRWLVDASGRAGLLARELDLRVPEHEHQIGSVWGRFENVADIDEQGPESFRARVRHTARRLSTIHFWYSGYWIWFIPLRGGLISVGVTGPLVRERKELRAPEGFFEFLRGHRAIAQLLAHAKLVDCGAFAKIAYSTKRYLSADRWGLTGEAATAADPLYSPGGDFISLENDYLCDLIERDLGGDASLALRARLYDDYLQFRQEATLRLYRGLYSASGSYELARAKWDFDLGCYYDLWLDAYLRDQHLDPDYLREQLRLRGFVLEALRHFAALFQRVEAHLRATGAYYRCNTGHFQYGLGALGFAHEVGTERSRERGLEILLEIFNRVRNECRRLLGEPASPEPLPLAHFLTGRAFD